MAEATNTEIGQEQTAPPLNEATQGIFDDFYNKFPTNSSKWDLVRCIEETLSDNQTNEDREKKLKQFEIIWSEIQLQPPLSTKQAVIGHVKEMIKKLETSNGSNNLGIEPIITSYIDIFQQNTGIRNLFSKKTYGATKTGRLFIDLVIQLRCSLLQIEQPKKTSIEQAPCLFSSLNIRPTESTFANTR